MLEVVLGLLGFLGIGRIYAGEVVTGLMLLVGWWIAGGLMLVITGATGGLFALLALPIWIAVPIISGKKLRASLQGHQGPVTMA